MAGKKKHSSRVTTKSTKKDPAGASINDSLQPPVLSPQNIEIGTQRETLDERLARIQEFTPILDKSFLINRQTHAMSRSRSVSPLAENRALMPLVPIDNGQHSPPRGSQNGGRHDSENLNIDHAIDNEQLAESSEGLASSIKETTPPPPRRLDSRGRPPTLPEGYRIPRKRGRSESGEHDRRHRAHGGHYGSIGTRRENKGTKRQRSPSPEYYQSRYDDYGQYGYQYDEYGHDYDDDYDDEYEEDWGYDDQEYDDEFYEYESDRDGERRREHYYYDRPSDRYREQSEASHRIRPRHRSRSPQRPRGPDDLDLLREDLLARIARRDGREKRTQRESVVKNNPSKSLPKSTPKSTASAAAGSHAQSATPARTTMGQPSSTPRATLPPLQSSTPAADVTVRDAPGDVASVLNSSERVIKLAQSTFDREEETSGDITEGYASIVNDSLR